MSLDLAQDLQLIRSPTTPHFRGNSSVSAKVSLVNILLRNYRHHFPDDANGPDYRN